MSSQGGVPSRKFSYFTLVYLFWYMYESDNVIFDFGDMSCMWNAVHVIGMVS